MKWTHLTYDKDQWRTLGNEPSGSIKRLELLSSCTTGALKRSRLNGVTLAVHYR
jgi:hypothetical protein